MHSFRTLNVFPAFRFFFAESKGRITGSRILLERLVRPGGESGV
jgi:hypothetical protein